MDRSSPESLIQFLDNATTSVRAALGRPMEDKSAMQMLANQSPTREVRRSKSYSRRRRGRNQQQRQSSNPDLWRDGYEAQTQILSDLFGITDQQKVFKEPHLTQWEDQLQWSPNMNREYSDDSAVSPGCMLDRQFQGAQRDGAAAGNEYCMYSDPQAYRPTEFGYGKETYSPISRSRYPYHHKPAPRTLNDVVNIMPVGCHLPPPIPSVCSMRGNRQPQEMDTVSKKMMPLILGLSEKEGYYDSPGIAKTREKHMTSSTQMQNNTECVSSDMELLSQLVTELDKTKTLDKLKGESPTYQHTSSNMIVEDLGRTCTGVGPAGDVNGIGGQTSFKGKPSNISRWKNTACDIKRQMFGNRSVSVELTSALQNTHIDGKDGKRNSVAGPETQRNYSHNLMSDFAAENTEYLRRASSSMSTLQVDITFGDESRQSCQDIPKQSRKRDRQSLLMALHERKSMPNMHFSSQRNYASHYHSGNSRPSSEHKRLEKVLEISPDIVSSNENRFGLQSQDQQFVKPWKGSNSGVNHNDFNLAAEPVRQEKEWGLTNPNNYSHAPSHDNLQRGKELDRMNPNFNPNAIPFEHHQDWSRSNHSSNFDQFSQIPPQMNQHQENDWNRLSPSCNCIESCQTRSSPEIQHSKEWGNMNPCLSIVDFNQGFYPDNQQQGSEWGRTTPKMSSNEFSQIRSPEIIQSEQWGQMNPSIKPDGFNQLQSTEILQPKNNDWNRSGGFNQVQSSVIQHGTGWNKTNSCAGSNEFNQMYMQKHQYQAKASASNHSNVNMMEFNQALLSNARAAGTTHGCMQSTPSSLPSDQWPNYVSDANRHVSSDSIENCHVSDINIETSISNDCSFCESVSEDDEVEEEKDEEDDEEQDNSNIDSQGKSSSSSSTSSLQLPSFSSTFL